MELLMLLLLTLVLMSLAVEGGQAELAVSGPNHVEVSAGEEAILICQVEHPYKFCSFIHPNGTNFNLEPNVNYEEGRISFAGSEEKEMKKSCGVKISPVVEADSGAWHCEVTAIVNDHPQVGRSEASITLIPLDISSIDTNVEMGESEGSGGGRLEASPNVTGRLEVSPNATNLNPDQSQQKLARGEDIIGDQMGEILSLKLVEIGNKTNGKGVSAIKSSELVNEEEMFVLSTEFIPEVEINYTEEVFSVATDQKQDTELNQATSPSPRIGDLNPSEKNSVSKYLKEVISTPIFEEEFGKPKDEQLNDLTDEHVLVVIIITMILAAIFITFIAKIKKILCFRLTDDNEDAERSTLKMDSNQKNRKLSQ